MTKYLISPFSNSRLPQNIHAGHFWRSRDELISVAASWTNTYGRAKAGRPEHTFSSYVRIRDVVLKTYQRWWTMSMDIPDPLSQPLSIFYRFRQVFKATPRIYAELLYASLSWSLCLCLAMWRSPLEYITYEHAPTSPALSCESSSW